MQAVRVAYDEIGTGYSEIRRPDPRLAAAIWSALADARSVVNIGAGSGSYEPSDREVVAVEPSEVMIAQRPADAAPAVKATAEALPFEDQSFDAAMAVLSMQHWQDVGRGLGEMLRVARQRLVLVTMDVEALASLWIVRDYLRELLGQHAARFPSIDSLRDLLPRAEIEVLPVPHDCQDGFMAAFWARPHAYLDPAVRAATSPWHDLPAAVVDRALTQLRHDLATGAWQHRYGHLGDRTELDVGLRLIASPLKPPPRIPRPTSSP